MVEITIKGPDAARIPIADMLERAVQGSRYTSRRFRKGTDPIDKTDGIPEQVRIVERE